MIHIKRHWAEEKIIHPLPKFFKKSSETFLSRTIQHICYCFKENRTARRTRSSIFSENHSALPWSTRELLYSACPFQNAYRLSPGCLRLILRDFWKPRSLELHRSTFYPEAHLHDPNSCHTNMGFYRNVLACHLGRPESRRAHPRAYRPHRHNKETSAPFADWVDQRADIESDLNLRGNAERCCKEIK